MNIYEKARLKRMVVLSQNIVGRDEEIIMRCIDEYNDDKENDLYSKINEIKRLVNLSLIETEPKDCDYCENRDITCPYSCKWRHADELKELIDSI